MILYGAQSWSENDRRKETCPENHTKHSVQNVEGEIKFAQQ